MINKYNEFTVVIDTREQQPWSFPEYTVANRKLDTGDYSVEGLENILCIERKKSTSEFANNIIESRFHNFILRMSEYKYAFLLLEFNLEDILIYPVGSTVPKKMWSKVKITPSFLLKHILDLQINHIIKIVFCGNARSAQKIAQSIMKKIHYIETIKNQEESNE